MSDWVIALVSILMAAVITAVVSFWGWLAVKVVEQGRKLVELEQRVQSRDQYCAERLEWIRSMDTKIDQVSEDTAIIRSLLGESPHV